ncbi:MFS transporter [Rhizorhabdus wittichii]|uniref:MFS transporter n=1 Tax=Rhizorhabdus wittichii TaxID=160791 RepID=A0A975HFV6_9SPHN|nr:MFS transporter [Rhizorhabdus wittichii]QTH23818.1 MFS transporter [Rhizorhabdus wittichii]
MATSMDHAATTAETEPDGSAARRGVRPWTTVWILTLLYAVAYFDKRLITLLIDPIRATIGATDLQMSLLSGAAFVSFYVIFSFPIGWAVDRLSRRGIIFWGVASWSTFAALGGFARSFWQLLGSRFGVGAGEAALMPAAHSMIADLFPREKLSRALGIFTLGAFIGSALSFAIGGAMLSHFKRGATVDLPLVGALFPWQAVLLLASLPGIPLALLIFLVREPARSHGHAPRIGSGSGRAWFGRHRSFYALHFIGFSTLAIMTAGFSSWLPTHMMRSFGEPVARVGMLLAIFQLTVGPLGMLLVARTVDRMFKAGRLDIHMTFYVWGVLVLAAAGMLVGLAPNAIAAYVGVVLFDSLHGGFLPVAGAVLQLTTPSQFRGQATAIFFVFYNVMGQALGPIAVATSTDLLFGSDRMIGPAIALTCAIVGPVTALLLLRSRRPMRAALADAESVAAAAATTGNQN